MKATRLLLAAALLISTAASAKDHEKSHHHEKEGDAEVILYMDGLTSESPELYEFSSPEMMREHIRLHHELKEELESEATLHITEIVPDDLHPNEAPAFVFTQKDNKFSFGMGGFINLRMSYDFNGAVENTDFVTAEIPVPGNYATKQQLIMDASTSRIYFAASANSRALGPIDIYMDIDFRGNASYSTGSGVSNTYQPRVRRAYASFLGLTIGRDITTFCDLGATNNTVDFQGPNAYAFNYATLIRYTHTLCDDHLTMAIALERPNLSATYNDNFEAIPQRVPDVPMYVQYQFGEKRENHLRASGVIRDLYAYNAISDESTTLLGWGVQFTGCLMPTHWLRIRGGGTYGEGITPYIQDLIGSGLDFTPDPTNPTEIQTMPMYAWYATGEILFSERLTASGGYSTVKVEHENGYYTADQYRKGQYTFANIFYNITPRFVVAGEYIYGTRRNMDRDWNSANRASLMAQFSF